MEVADLVESLERVKFEELLETLGVSAEENKVPTATVSSAGEKEEVKELQTIENEVNSMNLPNHQKYAILGSIDCTIEVLEKPPKETRLSDKDVTSAVESTYHIKPFLEDVNYYACSKEDVAVYLSAILANKLQYVNDKFDCDNFAKYVSAVAPLQYGLNTVGEAFVALFEYGNFLLKPLGLHACNVIVFSDKTADLYEPQLNVFLDKDVLTLKTKSGQTINILYVPFFMSFG